MLKSIGKENLPIVISSPGGVVEAVIELGRMIRKRQMSVGVGRSYADSCTGNTKDH
nr:hypothetical protein [uncultured Gellertiella sp.]